VRGVELANEEQRRMVALRFVWTISNTLPGQRRRCKRRHLLVLFAVKIHVRATSVELGKTAIYVD
jgi:hypothetical protein